MTHTFWLQSPESGKTHLSLDLHRRRLQTQHNWVCSATSPNENQNARCQRECWTKQWSESQQCLSELVCSRLSLLLCWIAALISIFSMKAIFSPLYNTFSVLLCQLEKGLVWDKPPTFAKTTDPTPAESVYFNHRLCRRWISGFCKGWWLVPHTAALWSRRRRCSLYWRALCSCRGCCGWRWRWWCVTLLGLAGCGLFGPYRAGEIETTLMLFWNNSETLRLRWFMSVTAGVHNQTLACTNWVTHSTSPAGSCHCNCSF